MKRTVPWAIVAFFPLVALIAVTVLEPASSPYLRKLAAQSQIAGFLVLYWWAILFAVMLVQLIWFLVAALRNRALPAWLRIIWSVAMFLFGPVAVPAYWWVHGERAE